MEHLSLARSLALRSFAAPFASSPSSSPVSRILERECEWDGGGGGEGRAQKLPASFSYFPQRFEIIRRRRHRLGPPKPKHTSR